MTHYDLLGIGIGPFNLSLAALVQKATGLKSLFLDQKPGFQWYPELMFGDAVMQTSYMKDLVTPVDPTSPYSFLNYLVQRGLFYSFLNTNRKAITRIEFDQYCSWVSQQLGSSLLFNSPVREVTFDKDRFLVKTDKESFTSSHLSIATGLKNRIPACAEKFLGKKVFHAMSGELSHLDLREKRVLVIGGGQTGVEVFRNALQGKWGRFKSLKLISRRKNLEPLDESPFTNEFFSPSYVNQFFGLDQETKDTIVKSQKLASDGNTPDYLEKLYNDIYQIKYVMNDDLDFEILPCRSLIGLEETSGNYSALINNQFTKADEHYEADIVILCTGFLSSVPAFLNPILPQLAFDSEGRLMINKDFDLKWQGPKENKIYALNFGRHNHGISEPQTSLMAWRSATIINDLSGKLIYNTSNSVPSFVQYRNNN